MYLWFKRRTSINSVFSIVMGGKVWGYSSNEDSDDDEVYLQNASGEEDLYFTSGSLPKLQFRNVKSKSRWNEEMEMAEAIEKNGKMLVTTGIVRSGKIYTSIEETLYLMELGALHLVDNENRSISLIEMYEKAFLHNRNPSHLPSRAEIESLERHCGGIPLKICLVTEGKTSFFSFDKDPIRCNKAAEAANGLNDHKLELIF